MHDTRTSAQKIKSFALIAVPLLVITAVSGWYYHQRFHAQPWSIQTLEARIAVIEQSLQITDNPELHYEAADLYYRLGRHWRTAQPPAPRRAAEALLHAMHHRPDLQGGWPYQAIGDLLQTAGADRETLYPVYQSLAQARSPGAAVRGHEALAIADLTDHNPAGYTHAYIASRYGHCSESCRQAVLNGPEDESPEALWCRGVALRTGSESNPEHHAAGQALLERYQQLRPWDEAARFYLQLPASFPCEIDLTKAFPSIITQSMMAPDLPPGTELRWPLFPTSECILTIHAEPIQAKQAARLEIWIDEKKVNSFTIDTAGKFTTPPIPPGHHILDLIVVPNGSIGMRLNRLSLDPRS